MPAVYSELCKEAPLEEGNHYENLDIFKIMSTLTVQKQAFAKEAGVLKLRKHWAWIWVPSSKMNKTEKKTRDKKGFLVFFWWLPFLFPRHRREGQCRCGGCGKTERLTKCPVTMKQTCTVTAILKRHPKCRIIPPKPMTSWNSKKFMIPYNTYDNAFRLSEYSAQIRVISMKLFLPMLAAKLKY